MRFSPGCGCCCSGTITFTVKSCGSSGPVIPGVTITVTSGATTVATGTTNSSGHYTTPSLPCGTYTWTASLTGWVSDTGSTTVVSGTNTVTSTGIRPSTIHITDANTTVALTWDATNHRYSGCYTLTLSIITMVRDPTTGCYNCTPGTGTVPVRYFLHCTDATPYTLTWTSCFNANCCDPALFPSCVGQAGYFSGNCTNCDSGFTTNGGQDLVPTGTYNPLSLSTTSSSTVSTFGCGGGNASIGAPNAGAISISL